MKIKQLVFVSFISIIIIGCAAPGSTPGGKTDKKVVSELTQKALDEREMTIVVNYINPVGSASFVSTDGYRLKISDGKVSAHLPYFGRSYAPMLYGADETGIVFDDCEIEIKEDYTKASRGKYFWRFEAKSGNENIQVLITFGNDGSAQIFCNCTNRSSISYNGDIVEDKPESEE